MELGQLGSDASGVAPVVRPDGDLSIIASVLNDHPEPSKDTNDPMNLQELDDGSVMVLGDEQEDQEPGEFDDNLAETLEEHFLSTLGSNLCESIESDKRVREERDKQYAEGIKRTGLGDEAPGGATFDGASRAVHPMLAKGCVDFASRAIKELFPANGPCKTQIIGESTDAKVDKAERKKQYMNWQLTSQVTENRPEFERLLSQLPLGGSQYKRWWWDASLGRPRTETVYVDDVFLPYNQSDFYTASRVTHRQYITKEEYERRVDAGLYRDIKLVSPPQGMEDKSESREASDKVEGSEEDSQAYNDQGLREVFMCYAYVECDGDDIVGGDSSPYILHIDKYSKRVLALYRNWAESDKLRKKKHWMVEYSFIPWRGAYGVGLAHLIGSLAASGTGAVRAILDAAHIQNFPGGLKLKGGRNSGQSVTVNATELAEIAAPPGVDDIRKLVMPFPFNGPSAVLFQLLEWLTQQAESVVTTASERIAEGGGANMPVGTAMALIESDSTNFSAIHARMHHSLKQEMAILHRLNAENLSDHEVVEELGELVVDPEDFKGPVDVIPVSDPNIFSEAQRFAQLQAVMQLADNQKFQQYFKPDRLLARTLKLLQLPSPEDIASLPKDPTRLGALEENYAAAANADEARPLKVYDDQDDMGHLQIHVHFMTSPIFGANPLIGPQALPALIQHCKDHLLALYRKHSAAATEAVKALGHMQGTPLTDAEAASHGSAFADATLAKTLGPMILPGLQQAMQAAQSMAPKPPVDPSVQAQVDGEIEIAKIRDAGDTTRKNAELASQEKREASEQAANANAANLAAAAEQGQQAVEEKLGNLRETLELMRNREDNQTSVFVEQIKGQNAKDVIELKAWLESRLAMMPDMSAQVAQLNAASGESTTALRQEVAGLREQLAQTHQMISGLVDQLNTVVKTKARAARQPKEAT
jgi:hypothetical protein